MNNLSKEKKQQIILVGMIGFGVLVALYFFVISSQNAKVRDIRTQTEEKAGEVEKAERNVKNAPVYQTQLEEIQKKLGAIEEGMLSGDVYGQVVEMITSFIRNGGHKITAVPSREEPIKVGLIPDFPYDAYKFTVRGQGFYHDIGKFLAEFENAFPYMRVQNLDLLPIESTLTEVPEKLMYRFEIVVLQKPVEKASNPK
ncbi:MAG: hypothetical protein AB1705_08165 [Verrucomicrobiota bacterium]